MQAGELVTSIQTFPGVSSLCAFGCDSGTISVFDSETNDYIFQSNFDKFFSNEKSNNRILSIDIPDETSLYAIDNHNLARFDVRVEQTKPIYQITYEYEIFDISCSSSSIFAVASRYNSGIITYDNRNLQRKINETQLNSIPPSALSFFDNNTLLVGYEDSSIGIWNILSEEYKFFDIPLFLHHRKLSPLSILKTLSHQSNDNYFQYLKDHEKETNENVGFIVGYQSGFSIYNYDGHINTSKLIYGESGEHRSFGQRGKFGKSVLAPCLGDNYIITIVDDSTLLPVLLTDDSSLYKSKDLHGSLLTSIAANKLFITAIEDDEEGYIAVLLPESFTDMEI